MIKNVCVFASSSNQLDNEFYADSAEFGRLMGINGMNIGAEHEHSDYRRGGLCR